MPCSERATSQLRISRLSSVGDAKLSLSPLARTAPVAFGPRVSTEANRHLLRSASSSPQPSAAFIQPRQPIPVVATT